MDIIEQNIVDAVTARLADIIEGTTVTTESGSYTYLSTVRTVSDGRVTPYGVPELPAVNVVTAQSSADPAGGLMCDHELVLILVVHTADKTPAPALRRLVSDLFACIGIDGTWGVPEVIKTDEPVYQKAITAAGDFIGAAQIQIPVTYRTARWRL